MTNVDAVRDGVRLRHVLSVCLLDEQRVMTVPELVIKVEAFGLPISGRASKTVSDSLRWEVCKGRVVRVTRSRYRAGSMPRSTEWWIRRQVDAYQADCRSDTGRRAV